MCATFAYFEYPEFRLVAASSFYLRSIWIYFIKCLKILIISYVELALIYVYMFKVLLVEIYGVVFLHILYKGWYKDQMYSFKTLFFSNYRWLMIKGVFPKWTLAVNCNLMNLWFEHGLSYNVNWIEVRTCGMFFNNSLWFNWNEDKTCWLWHLKGTSELCVAQKNNQMNRIWYWV